ncbi:MAG: GH3 auxin-responsive promoter family protein [Bacteroidales bacterium]|nr:GH3 auxin-responsive promoter family protein [Bacteroidales bacterium]
MMPLLGLTIKKAIELRKILPNFTGIKDPYQCQQRELKRLLRRASFTSIGEHYNFTEILKQKDVIAAYQSQLPITDYNSIFRKWWYRSLNGESFVTWPGRVKYFALSSGTSEAASKQIPVTADMLKAIKKTSIRQILTLTKYDFPDDFYQKGILMLGGSTHLNFNGTYYEGDLSGITAKNIPFWFQHFYKPGKRISRERDWTTKLEEIINKAPQWDIGVICGVPAWLQILLEKIINKYGLNNIHDIWPNLSIYVHGGVSFAPYKNGFEKLLGKPLTYIETYLASEGFIAYQSRPGTNSMELVLNNGLFFEFIDFNDDNFDNDCNIRPNAKTLTIEQIEENKDYALVLTSCSGAYRYLIGDTIKFTNKALNEIIITGRTKHFLNLCGEHLSLDNINRAVEMLENEFNIEIREFAVAGIEYESMFAHKWWFGTDINFDKDLAAKKIDEYLKILNDDYRVERIAAIRAVISEVLPVSVFYDWLKSKGKEGAQNKFPRVLKNDKIKDWETYLTTTNKSF